MKNLSIIKIPLVIGIAMIFSCNKSKYLDALPNQAVVEPTYLSDFQALLDNDAFMNGNDLAGLAPDLEQAGTDDYYALQTLSTYDIGIENLYTWNDNIYSYPFADWDFLYRCVFYANEVLDGTSSLAVSGSNKTEYENIRGSALYYRAFAFYHLAQVFAVQYDSATAGTAYGIPLRLSSSVNEPISRATLKDTYEQIIGDIETALPLLPVTPLYKTRPSRPAAYALLAKVFLTMPDYSRALLYADSCLQLQNTLMDYNTIAPGAAYNCPFARFNPEVIFSSVQINDPLVGIGFARVDSLLLGSYDTNDLRATLYFQNPQGSYFFRGSYDGTFNLFAGIATDEVYLVRAECYARAGNVTSAMNDLNTLLIKRWVTGKFTPFAASNASAALDTILLERRKELVFRGSRWMDLRRLNKEGAGITITRNLNGQTYTLDPNSAHYIYLIPPAVIGFNPNMPQNPR